MFLVAGVFLLANDKSAYEPILIYLLMKIKTIMPVCGNSDEYVPPLIEIFDVEIEQGFATSNGNNEQWNDVPGGGNF